MGKVILLLMCTCLILSSCAKDENTKDINSTLTQFAHDITQNSSDTSADTDVIAENNYDSVLIDVVGADYFGSRAIIRAEDEEIFGEICAVFQVGTNTEVRFTTAEWLAVSPDNQVYKYDVALDVWTEFDASTPAVEQVSTVSVENCIYALNEVYSDEFSAEYYDTEGMTKIAVYESEEAYYNGDAPALLLDPNEATPDGYFADPATAAFMPVYNFNSKAEINEHFSNYFTQRYLNSIQSIINNNFLDFDGGLYLVRGGMGYGMFSVDFDTIDYTAMQDNTLLINRFFGGEADGKVKLTFAEESGSLKLDSANYVLMYDMYNVNSEWEYLEVPDFLAFASENMMPTAPDLFIMHEAQAYTYSVKYLGDYFEVLPEYVSMLKLLGFDMVIDGYESFYSAEKYEDGYITIVNAYMLNEEDGVMVEISKQREAASG